MIHLIHGIRDNGERTTNVLASVLSRDHGRDVNAEVYPKTHVWNAWSDRDTNLIARSLIPKLRPGDHLVCHSHGCGVAMGIMEEISRDIADPYIARIVFLAPALGRWQKWSRLNFTKLLCIHNPMDLAIIAGSLIPRHPFGLAGAYGFRTDDPRVENRARMSFEGPFNHTAPYFRVPYVETLAAEIDDFLKG